MTTYAFHPQYSTNAFIGTAPMMYASTTSVPMVWSSAVMQAQMQRMEAENDLARKVCLLHRMSVVDPGVECGFSWCVQRLREKLPPQPSRKIAQRPPQSLMRWGWEVARGSQGQARPYGYHGRHGKHPGYRRHAEALA